MDRESLAYVPGFVLFVLSLFLVEETLYRGGVLFHFLLDPALYESWDQYYAVLWRVRSVALVLFLWGVAWMIIAYLVSEWLKKRR